MQQLATIIFHSTKVAKYIMNQCYVTVSDMSPLLSVTLFVFPIYILELPNQENPSLLSVECMNAHNIAICHSFLFLLKIAFYHNFYSVTIFIFWANHMKRVAKGAHLPTPWLIEPVEIQGFFAKKSNQVCSFDMGVGKISAYWKKSFVIWRYVKPWSYSFLKLKRIVSVVGLECSIIKVEQIMNRFGHQSRLCKSFGLNWRCLQVEKKENMNWQTYLTSLPQLWSPADYTNQSASQVQTSNFCRSWIITIMSGSPLCPGRGCKLFWVLLEHVDWSM